MGGRRLLVALIAAFVAALAAAPAAQATFHEISIREVYPGSVAQPDSAYIELQMYAGGQNLVGGQSLTVYGSGGAVSGTFTFPSNLPGGTNQQTILVGDSGVQAAFGVAPDLASASFAVAADGGAACWVGSLDCVSWGNFKGSTPGVSGAPADPLGIPNGMALRRTIEPGCPTLLQATDDSNASAADLFDSTPQPRNNASAIVETPCTGPVTTIDAKPANPTKATGASFTYHSAVGTTFECKLDAGAFASCDPSGVDYAGPLGEGTHTFQVRAKSEAGVLGNPASYTWRIDTTAPAAILDSHPTDSSPGASVPFTFHASEAGSSFECSLALDLAGDDFSACASGKTYASLTDGEYTFKVRATDAAGNQGSATAFEWTVDNTAVDKTPPDTVIDGKPPNPSASSAASFTYHSTEPGSSFECKLDGSAFSACPAAGVAYSGLVNGPHAFQVRAIDASNNVDQSPAGYSFDVAVPASAPVTPAAPASTPALSPAAAPVAKPPLKKRQKRRCHRGKHRGHATHRPGRRCQRGKAKPRAGATSSTFHLVMVREVYPGSVANPEAEYVELQMYVPGQELVHGHQISFFDKAGGLLGSTVFDSDVARGAGQSTIVAATPQAESQFGFAADKGMPGGRLDPAGGAVCWETLDCVAWGSFKGSLGSPTGSPADPLGIPDGMALRRTIAPGCPTLLEIGDDRNDSATDFADVFPAPRPNSIAPSERDCGSGVSGPSDPYGPTGGAGSRRRAPQTRIQRGPGRLTPDRTPTFRFSSSANGSTFLCKLDGHKFKRCHSPFTAPSLSLGPHVFRVKARSPQGVVDRSAAIRPFTVTRLSQ